MFYIKDTVQNEAIKKLCDDEIFFSLTRVAHLSYIHIILLYRIAKHDTLVKHSHLKLII